MNEGASRAEEAQPRRRYVAPVLIVHGTLDELTGQWGDLKNSGSGDADQLSGGAA
jgi:hypothetical protein